MKNTLRLAIPDVPKLTQQFIQLAQSTLFKSLAKIWSRSPQRLGSHQGGAGWEKKELPHITIFGTHWEPPYEIQIVGQSYHFNSQATSAFTPKGFGKHFRNDFTIA